MNPLQAGILNKAKGALGAAKEGIESVTSTVVNSGAGQATMTAAHGVAKAADDIAERTGAKAAYGAVSDKVSDGLDSLSGENVMREMRRRLDGQDALNDALASRLHEALTRIESLERQLAADRSAL